MQSKKFLRTIFSLLIVLIITTNYATKAKDKIRLYVNQEEVTNASPIIINNRTYVPIRFVEEALGGKVKWNQEKRQVDVNTNIKIIASIPEENIYLYANNKKYENNKETSMYKGLLLSVNNRSKYFDWENIDIITDYPELYYLDLTGDDKKELVVILSKGHGTGASSDSIHIIDPINFSEYKIENPSKTM